MVFRFVHSADWHIGKPFGRFPAQRAGVLQHARLEAVERLAALARREQAPIVLVAGDVYDGPGLADRALIELQHRLAAHADIAWYMIPGNHDPATPGGVWDRLAAIGLPHNVHVCREPRPVTVAPGIALLPAPLNAKATTGDPTAWMAAAPTPEGCLRIGLAHGSTHSFGADRQASVAISSARAREAGLAYLALGDWHGTREIAAATWYAGTPEPDSFVANDQGHALLVTVGAAATVTVARHAVGEMIWTSRRIAVAAATDLAELQSELARIERSAGRVLLDLVIEGEVTLAEDAAIRDCIDRTIDPAVFHLRQDLDALAAAPDADDPLLLSDPMLREIAGELATQAGRDDPQAPTAAFALRRLYRAARTAERAS